VGGGGASSHDVVFHPVDCSRQDLARIGHVREILQNPCYQTATGGGLPGCPFETRRTLKLETSEADFCGAGGAAENGKFMERPVLS
jgi:hypothetical protein